MHFHKFYRISNLKTPGMRGFIAAEVVFFNERGEDFTSEGRAFASSSINDNRGFPSQLFDKNPNTVWLNDWHNTDLADTWIAYESTTPYQLEEVSVLLRQDNRVPGDDWLSANIDYSDDGITWKFYGNVEFNCDTNSKVFRVPVLNMVPPPEGLPKEFEYWRVSNIKNRDTNQTYRSVGNLIFKAKTGEVSDNPAYGFSESHFDSDSLPGNAFDGLNTTYTLSSSLEGGLNSEEHGKSWWIGYKFSNPVELESIDISMRFDMEGVVDNITDNSLGQEWTYFQVEASEDGVTWYYMYYCYNPKIFKNDSHTHSYKISDGTGIFARWWRVSNIETLASEVRSAATLLFNNNLDIQSTDITKCFSESFSSASYPVEKAFDNDSSTYTRSRAFSSYEEGLKNYYIGYVFEKPVQVLSISVQMQTTLSTNVNREWQTAFVEYSLDGTSWKYYGLIEPKIPKLDSTLKENIPVKSNYFSSSLEYSPSKTSSDSTFKFWRCSNIKTEPSEESAILNNSIAKLDFKNTENLKISSIYNTFSSSNERLGSSGYLRTSEFAFDENPETHAHSRTAIDSAENYTIGCMFDTPVEVTSLGIQARHDLTEVWGENWQSCTIDKSENGFDWYPTAYCIFNTPRAYTGYLESELFSLNSLGPKYKFWRVINPFYSNLKNTLEFSLWELRFNTLTGEISNIPSKAFSNSSWSTSYLPENAFDTNTSTGVYPEKDFQEPYYIGYEFNSPQYVNSLYILFRRDSSLLNEYLLFIEVQASEDGVTWVSQGYSNLDTLTESFFCLSYIEPYNLIDKLTTSSLEPFNSISFKELEFKPFGSTLIDTNNISINIYTKDNDGTISGEVTELDIPVIREVGLYDRATRQLIAVTWSDEKGQYKFTGLDSTRKYYVHAIDSNDFYNAVTQDMIEPLI